VSAISENYKTEPDFVFIGEHPALDFANTRFAPHGEMIDLFGSWADIVNWFSRAGLSTDPKLGLPATESTEALAAIKSLRQAWCEELPYFMEKRDISDSFLERLNLALSRNVFQESFRRGAEGMGLVRLSSPLQGADLALALIARQIADFLAQSNPEYLRRCANSACVLHFYDTTKNHRRQWCSGALCGNRHKVAAFRRRHAKSENSHEHMAG
jgi:predicted RNA-binding Zn ribbon-like protein